MAKNKSTGAKVFSIGNLAESMAKDIAERVEGVEAKANFDLREIPLDEIVPHPDNKYGMRGLEELAESLRKNGQKHNAVVRPYTDDTNPEIKYQLISGERRWRALQMIGAATIFAKVEEHSDLETLELIDVINLQTRELSEMERAEAVERLFKLVEKNRENGVDYGGKKTREVVANMMSNADEKVNPATVAQLKKLNELIPEFKQLVDSGDISRELGYQYSQLSEEQQKLIYNAFEQGKELTAKEAQALKGELQKKDADHQKIVEDYKKKIQLKEEEAQDFKKDADEANVKLKEATKAKSEAEKELKDVKASLSKLEKEQQDKAEKANKDIEALRAEIKAEVEKETAEQNEEKIKHLQGTLDTMEKLQEKEKLDYQKKADELQKALDEKTEQLKEKEIERNLTEGNKAIQSLARQAQKALSVLLDEIAVYIQCEGFVLTEETKQVLAEIKKHEGEINKNR